MRRVALALVLALAVAGSACGKVGPPRRTPAPETATQGETGEPEEECE